MRAMNGVISEIILETLGNDLLETLQPLYFTIYKGIHVLSKFHFI